MEKMTGWVCERCKVFLLQVTTKMTEYHLSELNANGAYEWIDHGESEYEYTLCPLCTATENDEHGLKSIELPVDLQPKLIELWELLIKEESDKQSKYGIPLSNERLKELLVEYLV